MSHEILHAEVEATLPPHIRLAYDGLVVPIRDSELMDIFRSLDQIPADFGPTVASIGNFDGRPSRPPMAARRDSKQRQRARSEICRGDLRSASIARPSARGGSQAHHPHARTPRSAPRFRNRRCARPSFHRRALQNVRTSLRHRRVARRPACHRSPRGRQLPLRPQGAMPRRRPGRNGPRPRLPRANLFAALLSRHQDQQQQNPRANPGRRHDHRPRPARPPLQHPLHARPRTRHRQPASPFPPSTSRPTPNCSPPTASTSRE